MNSYSADVTVSSDSSYGDGGSFQKTIKGHLKLLKPNMYHITWGNDHPHAVWNNGKGAFYFFVNDIGQKFYGNPKMDRSNLDSAVGISSGITYTAPFLFFKEAKDIFSDLHNFHLIKSELLNNEDCTVIEASGDYIAKRIFWISKASNVMVQVETRRDSSIEKDPYAEELTDEKIKQSLSDSGRESTPENIAKLKELYAETRKTMQKMGNIKSITKEIFTQIQINSKIDIDSLEFVVPEGVPLGK